MQLTENDITKLRQAGKLLEHEVVTKEGDVIVATNPTTGEKRIVDTSGLMLEGNRKLLLD